MVNCCEGSKVLCLYYIMLLCFIMCALHEHVTTIKSYKRLHSFVQCEEMSGQFVVQCCGRLYGTEVSPCYCAGKANYLKRIT